jgi:hypothetical protein
VNIEHEYTMYVTYPDQSVMTVPEADAEGAIMFAQDMLKKGAWMRAELHDDRGELVWAGSRGKQHEPN